MMTSAEHRLGQNASVPGVAGAGEFAQDTSGGARLRLALGVAGLAALVAWGMATEVRAPHADAYDASGEARAVSATGPRYDGHGKWTGYLPY